MFSLENRCQQLWPSDNDGLLVRNETCQTASYQIDVKASAPAKRRSRLWLRIIAKLEKMLFCEALYISISVALGKETLEFYFSAEVVKWLLGFCGSLTMSIVEIVMH